MSDVDDEDWDDGENYHFKQDNSFLEIFCVMSTCRQQLYGQGNGLWAGEALQ